MGIKRNLYKRDPPGGFVQFRTLIVVWRLVNLAKRCKDSPVLDPLISLNFH